jgi:hypothetical protein
MAGNLVGAVQEFDANDKTARLVDRVMKIIPRTPQYRHAGSLRMLAQQLQVDPSPKT